MSSTYFVCTQLTEAFSTHETPSTDNKQTFGAPP
jgi:hypothetical protein